MEFLLFWLACAVLGSMIGSAKGAGFSGFVLGLLLGPIGVLIVLVSNGNRRKCPLCAERIQVAAKVCPHCRNEIKPG